MKVKMKKLPDVLFFQEGPGVRKFQFRESGVKLINVGNINNGQLDTTTTKLFISNEEAYGKYKHFLVDEGDLLIASSGVVVDNFHNKIAFADKDQLPLCMNTSTIRFKSLDKDKFNLHYFKFFLKTNFFKSQLRKLITGSAQLNFGPSHLKQIEVPVPQLSDQIHIANILSKAEVLITQRKESIRLLDEFLKSTFMEMFGDLTKVITKEYFINDLKAGNNGTFSNGPFGSDLLTSELKGEGVPVIYIRDIRNGVYSWRSKVFVADDKAQSLSNCQVLGEDVLFAKVGDPPGISAVYPKGSKLAIITQDVIRIRLNQKIILPNFFSFLFNSEKGKQLIKKISIEGTRNRFALGDFKKLKIDVPSIELQTQFAQIVEKTEALKAQYHSSLLELENLYGSLSQRAFKGEL